MMHGTLVGLGILAATLLQCQPADALRHFFDATGIASTWRDVDAAALATLAGMPAFVRENGYPAPIWDRVSLSEAEATALAAEVLAR
jgi:hypothetical protein